MGWEVVGEIHSEKTLNRRPDGSRWTMQFCVGRICKSERIPAKTQVGACLGCSGSRKEARVPGVRSVRGGVVDNGFRK